MLKLNAGLCFHYESSESLQEPGAGFHSLSPFPPSFLLGRAGHGMLASERALAGQGRRVSGLPRQPGDSSLSRTGAPVCTLGPVLQTVPLNRPGSAGLSMLRGPCPSNRGACCPMESQQHVQRGGHQDSESQTQSVSPVSAFLLMPELCFCFCSGTG